MELVEKLVQRIAVVRKLLNRGVPILAIERQQEERHVWGSPSSSSKERTKATSPFITSRSGV